MRGVMVRYRVKPEHAAENERLVRAVYEELAEAQPAGFHYATFVQDDGVSFVHVAFSETEEAARALPGVAAFQRFQAGVRDRCDEPPVVAQLREVGSFRFHADGASGDGG